jgi:hypothetical protein
LEPIDHFDGFAEVAALDGHDHIDGVEVLVTAKTPGQIGFGIGCGVKLGAQGTEESEVPIRDLAGKTQEIGDEACNGDVVSKGSEFFL